ncbi:uncharacterized protein LOC124698742 [Lolium rigidum]|uniref:uncharacterized protein LOC124698742 n=1 Tax=Lolium rigidum TaxID=89674 RepID=UPI001F5DE808|nr:uncharacterized protein LOC124698742 [Lolium rigidum]
MMHGPCGTMNDKCPCMKKGSCSKHYPKPFNNETSIDQQGFPIYRRRDDGRYIYKNDFKLDNKSVVPYNLKLLKKYQCHINVEWCNKTKIVKYLFKYVTKGKDRSRVVFETIKGGTGKGEIKKSREIDEVQEYLDCRHLVPHDSLWRIYEFPLHCKMPTVERLDIHLPGMNSVTYKSNSNLHSIVKNSKHFKKTMLTEWFVANKKFPQARHLAYCNFPTEWNWQATEKIWKRKPTKRTPTAATKIGRVYYVHPSAGERFYLRMLLMVVQGASSYQDLRTFNTITYETFKEACAARGLLGDDTEWYTAFDEALVWATSRQLRHLFVTIILFCSVDDERAFYNKYYSYLTDDIQLRYRGLLNDPSFIVPADQLQDMLIEELNHLFMRNGSSISNFNLPQARSVGSGSQTNRLIEEEFSYDLADLLETSAQLNSKLNAHQRKAYEEIVDCVMNKKPGFFFLSGHGGTGKTFVWKAILSFIRSRGKIALAVASSGVASLLLQGGRTAHSRFKIPIDIDETTLCDVKRGTNLSDLLIQCSLIIWDEAPMTHRHCFETLDRTLRDILGQSNPEAATVPFGGVPVVLGGDFRQILPVIEGGSRAQIVGATITICVYQTQIYCLNNS